jgi:signal peptide peptidase SppA
MYNRNTIAEAEYNSEAIKPQIGKLDQILSFLPMYRKSKPTIAILNLTGVIGRMSAMKSGLSLDSLNQLIEKAFKTKNLTAICLIINSPGGSPVQSELIAKRIRTLATEKKVPIYSFVEDCAASGGYWLACAGDQIYASASSIVGSIGVISAGFGFTEAISKLGVERRVYSEGRNKSILDPFMPVQKEDISIIKKIQKQVHEHFIDYVKERRIGKLTQEDDILFNGEFWSGNTALDYGLIDGLDDMYNFIKKKYGDVTFKYINEKQSWIKKKLGIGDQGIIKEFSDSLIESVDNRVKFDKFNI